MQLAPFYAEKLCHLRQGIAEAAVVRTLNPPGNVPLAASVQTARDADVSRGIATGSVRTDMGEARDNGALNLGIQRYLFRPCFLCHVGFISIAQQPQQPCAPAAPNDDRSRRNSSRVLGGHDAAQDGPEVETGVVVVYVRVAGAKVPEIRGVVLWIAVGFAIGTISPQSPARIH
jgi:hypothetical protein